MCPCPSIRRAYTVLIGDSVAEVQAAHGQSTATIVYANKPRKYARLAAQNPDAVIHEMTETAPQLLPDSLACLAALSRSMR